MEMGTGLGDLKTAEWQELQLIADRFEKAWQKVGVQGEPPDLGKFLPPPQDPLRKLVLQELVKTDLEARWRRDQSTGVEFYVQRFPELGAVKELSPALLFEEYRIRHEYGDKPPVTAYQRRFPHQFEDFQRLIRDQPLPTNIVTITAPPPAATPTGKMPTGKLPSVTPTGSTSAPTVNKTLTPSGGYNLIERIGSGSFGEVWRAEAPGGVICAVKVLSRPVDHETAQRELESLEIIKNIRHPFLLATQNFQISEDRLYIVMELADGSMRSRLKQCRKEGHTGIPLEELILYFHESAEALDFLHVKGVQHRDIKPDNILLLERHVKVADFGLARLQGERSMVTATSSGTPAYMGPEVWSGRFHEHSDQYALAFTYAELRLDRRVFGSVSLPEMMNDHLNNIPDLEPMPEPEQEVVLRAMSKDPTQRFPSCREFAQALDLATLKERGKSLPGTPGAAGSEAPTANWSQGATDPWSTMGGPLPATLQQGQSTAVKTVPWKPPTVSRWPLFAGMGVALFALIAMGVYSYKQKQIKEHGTVAEADPKETLPEGFEPVDKEDIIKDLSGKRFYRQIVGGIDPNLKAKFVCIPRNKPEVEQGVSDPETFYIMVDKVTVGQFQQFAEKKSIGNEWKKTKIPNKDETKAPRIVEVNDIQKPDLPVINVTVTETHDFGQEMISKKAYLPTYVQWDKAAGYYERQEREGPYKGTWSDDRRQKEKDGLLINVNRPDASALMPVGSAKDDESIFGCRDMAGNGREWTRNLQTTSPHYVPYPEAKERDVVITRGKEIWLPVPLQFTDLGAEKGGNGYYFERNPDIGFRMVIETVKE
jgi:serine/threonine protein kinase